MQLMKAFALGGTVIVLAACSAFDGHGGGPGMRNWPPYPGVKQNVAPVGRGSGGYPEERYSFAICDAGTCNFSVGVASGCKISLDPQYLAIRRGTPLIHTLVFNLVTTGPYSFNTNMADAIAWDLDVGSGQQAPTTLSATATQVKVEFKNTPNTRRYKFGIPIVDTNNGQVCGFLDPGVIPDL